MKNKSKSNERLLLALTSIKTMIDQDQKFSFEKFYDIFKISRSTQTILKKMGIIISLGNKKYQWVGEPPTLELCDKLKKYHNTLYHNTDEQVEQPELEFETQTVDDKLNHINFMLDQLFDRVNYIFESLADESVKRNISSEWFKKK